MQDRAQPLRQRRLAQQVETAAASVEALVADINDSRIGNTDFPDN